MDTITNTNFDAAIEALRKQHDNELHEMSVKLYHLKQEMDNMEHRYEYAAVRVAWRSEKVMHLMETLLMWVEHAEKGTLPESIDIHMYVKLLAEKTMEHVGLIQQFNDKRNG